MNEDDFKEIIKGYIDIVPLPISKKLLKENKLYTLSFYFKKNDDSTFDFLFPILNIEAADEQLD
jgi:hypothetical protein